MLLELLIRSASLTVCALADAMGMQQAMVPIHSGVLSALGMLMAPRGRHLSHAQHGILANMDAEQIDAAFAGLHAEGCQALLQEGVAAQEVLTTAQLDLRYQGQSYTLSIRWQPERGIEHHIQEFHKAHLLRYGHDLNLPIELVTLRLKLTGSEPEIQLQPYRPQGAPQINGMELPIYQRSELPSGQPIHGPALVIDPVSTTWLASGWRARGDSIGNLMLSRVA